MSTVTPSPAPHSYDWFMERQQEASLGCAQTAITNPGIYPVYGEWCAARDALENAKARVKAADEAWLEFIKPALDDPDYRSIAQKKGLLP
jgi:hypothetical protein